MNTAAGALLFVAFGVAVVDWVAVARAHRHLEQVAKPATMAMLVGAAALLSGTHPALQAAVTVGLALCGAGDVLLLDPDRWFVAGLGAFLLGHLAYIVGFALVLDSPVGILAGVAVVAAGIAVIGVRILAAVRRGDRALVVPITAYIGVLSAMVSWRGARAAPSPLPERSCSSCRMPPWRGTASSGPSLRGASL